MKNRMKVIFCQGNLVKDDFSSSIQDRINNIQYCLPANLLKLICWHCL